MKAKGVIFMLQMIYSFTNVVIGKNIVVDISCVTSDNSIRVTEKRLPKGGLEYIFQPKNRDVITSVQYYGVTITNKMILNARNIVFYKFKSALLLKIPNPKHTLFSNGIEKSIYYRSAGDVWRKTNIRVFQNIYYLNTYKPAVLDLSRGHPFVKKTVRKSIFTYTPIKDVYVVKVKDGTQDIWPQEMDLGSLFLTGEHHNVKGKSALKIKFKDTSNKTRINNYILEGQKWIKLSNRTGKPLRS
ncbi:hypothetical protein BdWA1_003180 [Babesia duncani]|uniref:Uncharacterized protein n=1 Tax=Babesia duncani TaxID=323732 RepID=A0AAD9UN35_9APIC|nr:hypothetical protein BdWA1_003180 [Babesia duncani]